MFKNRVLMSGIGIGLIVGAILLQVMITARSTVAAPAPNAAVKPDEMDQKQLKEVASRYYQVYDKSEKLYTQSDVDAKVKEAVNAQANAVKSQAPAAGKQIAVYVSQGLIAAQVADLLYRSGVIVDRNAFEKLVADRQVADKIQVGYHVFNGVTDPQQVIATLTSPQ